MAITSGSRLGRYQVLDQIGAGGMGEVFRALDTSLGRHVALKALPAALSADAAQRQRFEREARLLASLNHPNVVTIHSVDHADGETFLTMELVHGQRLSNLIQRGGLPVERLLDIGLRVTEAVDAAHAHGILHRDLKPSNVMITPEGGVKVLDFGLAKVAAVANSSETVSANALTAAGHILGTVAYMSPEQAQGHPVDARSDIFSLGVMLYEMATGTRPFSGATNLETMTAILRDTPQPVSDRNPQIPKELGRIIRRALAKDPERRQQTVKDLRNELAEIREELDSGELFGAPPANGVEVSSRRRIYYVALPVVAAVLAVLAVYWTNRPDPGGAAQPRQDLNVTVEPVTAESGLELFPSLSPDGKWVVYTADERGAGQTDIMLRAVGERTAINLTRDVPADDSQPAFSPDGARIVFRSERDGGGLFLMGRTGDSVRRLTTEGFNPSWSPDGTSVVYGMESVTTNPAGRSGTSVLWIVSPASGARHQLTTTGDAVQPSWSPGGHRIAYWALSDENGQRDLWTIAATGGPPVRVTNDTAIDWNPVWSPDGSHLYFSSNRSGVYSLWRVPIDEVSGLPSAQPEVVALPRSGVAHFSISGDGKAVAMSSLLFQTNLEALELDVTRRKVISRRSLTSNSETAPVASEHANPPSVSPDGKLVVFDHQTITGQLDLWIAGSDGTNLRQLTNDAARDNTAQWSADGSRVLFRSDRGGRFQVWSIAADGSSPRQVTDYPGVSFVFAVSPDGRQAIGAIGFSTTVVSFDPRAAAADQRIEALPQLPGDLFIPQSWSPDGTRVAGSRVGAGRVVIYSVASKTYAELPQTASACTWLLDNRTLICSTGRELRLLDTATRASTLLYSVPHENMGGGAISPDGGSVYLRITKQQGDIVLGRFTDNR